MSLDKLSFVVTLYRKGVGWGGVAVTNVYVDDLVHSIRTHGPDVLSLIRHSRPGQYTLRFVILFAAKSLESFFISITVFMNERYPTLREQQQKQQKHDFWGKFIYSPGVNRYESIDCERRDVLSNDSMSSEIASKAKHRSLHPLNQVEKRLHPLSCRKNISMLRVTTCVRGEGMPLLVGPCIPPKSLLVSKSGLSAGRQMR